MGDKIKCIGKKNKQGQRECENTIRKKVGTRTRAQTKSQLVDSELLLQKQERKKTGVLHKTRKKSKESRTIKIRRNTTEEAPPPQESRSEVVRLVKESGSGRERTTDINKEKKRCRHQTRNEHKKPNTAAPNKRE